MCRLYMYYAVNSVFYDSGTRSTLAILCPIEVKESCFRYSTIFPTKKLSLYKILEVIVPYHGQPVQHCSNRVDHHKN